MNQASLIEKLKQLRAELVAAPVGEKLQGQLESLIVDIERALADPAAGSSESGDSSGPATNLSGETQDLLLKFEADHPEVTGLLNQVATALANLGI